MALQQENNPNFYANFWLNCICLEASLISKSALLRTFSKNNIDARSLWYPLHLQPYLKGTLYYGDHYSKRLFETGLCLPSSSNLTSEEFHRIDQVFKSIAK
jgi:dTDP-4-amino-4,6-dideoxygalactose transaminase